MKKLVVFLMLFVSLSFLEAKTNIKQAEKLIKDRLVEVLTKTVRDSGDIPIIDKSKKFDFLYNPSWNKIQKHNRDYSSYQPKILYDNILKDFDGGLTKRQLEFCINSDIGLDIKEVFVPQYKLEVLSKDVIDSIVYVITKDMKDFNRQSSEKQQLKVRMFVKVMSVTVEVDGEEGVMFIGSVVSKLSNFCEMVEE